MISRDHIQPVLIKTSFIILTIYFFFALTNVHTSLLRSNFLLLAGLVLAALGFIFSVSFNWTRILPLSILSIIILGTIIYYKIFPVSDHVNYDYTLLFVLFFLMTIGNVKIRDLINISFFTQITLLLLTLILFFTHVIPETLLNRGDSIRHSLGFAHPNLFSLICMCLTIEYLYLFLKRITWIHLIIVFLLNIGVYFITFSRTSFACISLMLIFTAIAKYTQLLKKHWMKLLLSTTILMIFLLSVILPMTYTNNGIYNFLNKVLSNRLTQGYFYYENYGISLFGQPISNVTKIMNYSLNRMEGWVLDIAYLRILIQHGLIVFIAILIFVLVKSMELYSKGYKIEVCTILVCLIYGIFERYAYNIFIYTTPLLLFIDQQTSRPGKYNIYFLQNKLKHFFKKRENE